MGKNLKLTCKNCGKIYQTKNGCGMSHARLDNVITNFKREDIDEIEKLGKASLFPVFQFEYKSAYCKQCNHIVSVPVLKFPANGKIFYGSCEVCGQDLKEESITDILCPVCGQKQWDEIMEGFWD